MVYDRGVELGLTGRFFAPPASDGRTRPQQYMPVRCASTQHPASFSCAGTCTALLNPRPPLTSQEVIVPTLSRLTVGRVLALTGLWAYLTAWAFEADGGEDSASPSPSRLVRITVGISVLAICASVIAIFEPPRYDCVFGMITFGELWRALLATASWCMFAGTGLSHLQILELAVFGGCAGVRPYVNRCSRHVASSGAFITHASRPSRRASRPRLCRSRTVPRPHLGRLGPPQAWH